MKVLIDAYYLTKTRGLGRYTRELLHALSRFPEPDMGVHVLVPKGQKAHWIGNGPLRYHEATRLTYPLWEQMTVPLVRARLGAEVTHSLYNTMPLLHRQFVGQVVTFHDLAFLDPTLQFANLTQRIGALYRRCVTHLTQGGRQTLVTTNPRLAGELRKVLHKPARSIDFPVDAFRAQQVIGERPDGLPYFLHVGGDIPLKNTRRTIEAFRQAAPKGFRLVVAGTSLDWQKTDSCDDPCIEITGLLDDARMATYYHHAAVVLFPSLNEAYGLPVIEALAFGVPLITSDRDPMRMLAGDAALLVDPESIVSIAAAIRTLADDVDRRQALIAAGKARARRFSAEAMARQLHDVYRGLA